MLPPGILVGFGIDVGPAITFVERGCWIAGGSTQQSVGAALTNLREPLRDATGTTYSMTKSATCR